MLKLRGKSAFFAYFGATQKPSVFFDYKLFSAAASITDRSDSGSLAILIG